MLSSTFTNNNNTNPPTRSEINTKFSNFRRMKRSFTPWAHIVFSSINTSPIHELLYACEEVVEEPEYDWWFEPYIYYYTLHVFYMNKKTKLIHHNIHKLTYNEQLHGFSANEKCNLYRRIDTCVENFDYDTLREFKLPPLECPPSSV
jgi:hypothetical protein